VLRVSRSPQAGIESDVIVADLEVAASGHDVHFPTDAVDDQPVTDLFAALRDSLQAESLEVGPDPWVGFVPLPEVPLALVKRLVHEPAQIEELRPD